jgi:hypothetical protein
LPGSARAVPLSARTQSPTPAARESVFKSVIFRTPSSVVEPPREKRMPARKRYGF